MQKATGSPFPAVAKPWEIAVHDLNGDGNPDLIVIPYQRDIRSPNENAVSILLGDGHGGFHIDSPLPLENCRGPNSVAAGDNTGNGTQTIAVACAESRTIRIYHQAQQENSLAEPDPCWWLGIGCYRAAYGRSAQRNYHRQC